MPGRVVVAAVALLTSLLPWAAAAAEEPDQGSDEVVAFLLPDATTYRAPWIAHLGDHASTFAVPVRPEGGSVAYASCSFEIDGVGIAGSVSARNGLCFAEHSWDRVGTVEVIVDLVLEDGSHVLGTEAVEVRERPSQRQRIVTGRRAAIDPAPAEMDTDLLAASFGDPSLPAEGVELTPCVIRGRGPERTFPPTVRCTERGDHVLVVSDADTGWSLRIDLAVRNRPTT